MIGAEIEVDAWADPALPTVQRVARRWGAAIVTDGSLAAGGRELCLPPASGTCWVDMVSEIAAAIHDDGGQVTSRCGLHVHVDARDVTWYDLRRVLLLYAATEPAWLATQPASRVRSSYCKPCGGQFAAALEKARTPKDSKKQIIQNVWETEPSRTWPRLKTTKWNDSRYAALNVHSWIYRGTLECRLHTGTIRDDKIVPWGTAWASFVDFALATPEAALPRPGALSLAEQARLLCWIAPASAAYLQRRWAEHGDSTLANILAA